MEFLKHAKSNFSRRKFFLAGTIALSGIGLLKIFSNKKKSLPTAMFLSEDGKLVEVQLRRVPGKKILATTNQVKKWVWKKEMDG